MIPHLQLDAKQGKPKKYKKSELLTFYFIKMHICDLCDIRSRDGELFEGFFFYFCFI